MTTTLLAPAAWKKELKQLLDSIYHPDLDILRTGSSIVIIIPNGTELLFKEEKAEYIWDLFNELAEKAAQKDWEEIFESLIPDQIADFQSLIAGCP